MGTSRPRRVFTDEFKADAVAMVTQLGRPRAEVARDLGIGESTLGRWVASATGTAGAGSGSNRRAPDLAGDDPNEMRRELARLREENAFLKKAGGLLRAGTAVVAKYRLIRSEEGNFPITMMCRLLQIERSGYYAWRGDCDLEPAPESRAGRRVVLADRIHTLWEQSRRVHGARRIHADLLADGQMVSLWLVRSIMAELKICGLQPRATRRTTVASPEAGSRENLVRRRFCPPVPTTMLVGDITYLKTGEGWLYLATVIDLTTRMVVGWSTASTLHTGLIISALRSANQAGYVAGGAVFHSDRGTQYTSAAFAGVAEELGVRLSVERTGVCWDNAVAESFFSMLKNEMFHHYRFATRTRARLAVADYIEVFYNRRRRHSTIGYQTPAEVMAGFWERMNYCGDHAA
ncbi:IS3 family transposase [Gordonia malaquae]|uniref:IS3 family transposase n=1 Tax=Gordonia malaquae TaxID=410332 RepID=UPI0030FE6EBF